MSSERHRTKKLFLIFLAGIVLLIEIALRIAFPQKEYTYFYTKSDSGYWHEDPELFWIHKKEISKKVSQISHETTENLLYCFGGSIVRGDFANTNFCEELEGCLPQGYKSVTFGVSGYTSYQSSILFKRIAAIKKPRIAVFCLGWNDHSNGPASDLQMAERNQRFSTHLLYWLSKSKFVQVFRRVLRDMRGIDPYHPGSKAGWSKRVALKDFRGNMKELSEIAKENRIQLVLMSQGNLDSENRKALDPYFAVMKSAADYSEHVHFLDVRPGLSKLFMEKFSRVPQKIKSPEADYLFLDQCHLNDFGHRQVAEMLCEFLDSHDLLH